MPTPQVYSRVSAEKDELLKALSDCVAAWEKWFSKLPDGAEDDEFGAFLNASNLLRRHGYEEPSIAQGVQDIRNDLAEIMSE